MATKKASTEVAEVAEPTDDALALNTEAKGIDFVPDSWEQVAEFYEGEIIEFQGSPYKVIDKKELVDRPFMIVDVRFYHSKKYDSDAVAVMALTKDNERIVFNDGSLGVFEQVKHMVNTTKRKSGIICSNGLRASTYTVEVTDGMSDEVKEIEATTYYVA